MSFGCLSGKTIPMSGRIWRVVAALGLVAAVMGSIPARPAAATTSRVVLAEMRYNPPHLEITLGDSVLWEAADDGHTVTASDGSFDSSPRGLMAEGDEYRYRFRAPGTYTYFCRIHQGKGMRGDIVVVDPYAPTTTTRLTPVTAAATTSTVTTTTTAPTTTTSRVLATSSSTSPSVATSTTAPSGTSLLPQEPPTLNPDARVVGSPPPDPNLPGAQAAARRSGGGGSGPGVAVFFGVLAALGVVGGSVLGTRGRRRGRRRRGPGGRRPPA